MSKEERNENRVRKKEFFDSIYMEITDSKNIPSGDHYVKKLFRQMYLLIHGQTETEQKQDLKEARRYIKNVIRVNQRIGKKINQIPILLSEHERQKKESIIFERYMLKFKCDMQFFNKYTTVKPHYLSLI